MLTATGLFLTLPFITRRVGDPDYWWHELTGQWIAQHGAFARHELYTYTVSGAPWTDHEYLSQLLYYGLNRIGGLATISIFFAAVVWAGFWLLLARVRLSAHSPWIAGAGLVLGAAAGFAVWGPRPQMFDFLFVSLELFWIDRFLRGRGRALYALPAVVLLWANLHGGFVFSFFFLGLAIAAVLVRWLWEGRRDHAQLIAARQLGLVAVASAVASLATPWGPSLFIYVWRTQFSSQLAGFVTEWQSPDFHMANMLAFEAMLLLVVIGFAWKRPRLLDVFFVIGSAVLALHALLFIPIFVAVATPVVIWQWSDVWEQLRDRWRATRIARRPYWLTEGLGMLLALALIGSVAFSAYTLQGQAASTRANYPVAAADWLASHSNVGTRVFNEYSWGGYLAYRFYPEPTRRVFIYGESELMGDTLLAKYSDIDQLHGDWSRLLDQFGVDYVVFPVDTRLVSALDASPNWHRAYSDSVAVIFTRASGAGPAQ